MGFVVGFATFLFGCVNWPLLLSTYDVSQAVSFSQLAKYVRLSGPKRD